MKIGSEWVISTIVFLFLMFLKELHIIPVQDSVILIDIALLLGVMIWYFRKSKEEKMRLNPWFKKSYGIAIITFLMFLFLRAINVFQEENGLGSISVIFFFTIVATITITYMEKESTRRHEEESLNYDNLDFLRYICAIIIIILHLRPFLGVSNQLDLAFNNIVSRICVPLFFVITGYFAAKKEVKNPNYIKQYIKSTIPFYLMWCLIYLPVLLVWVKDYFGVAWTWISGLSISPYLLGFLILLAIPIALVIALLYTGTFYHLWYFPALLLSLWVLKKWKEHFPVSVLLGISFVLLLFGATETYFGVLPVDLRTILSYYFDIFFTTRNFLFFGLFYVVLGYHIGLKKDPYRPYSFLKFLLAIYLLVIEGILLQLIDRLDSNILLSCVPLVYYLFLSVLYMKRLFPFDPKYSLRELSKYYYLLHPMVIVFLQTLFPTWMNEHRYMELVLVLIITHIASLLLLKWKKHHPNAKI